MLVLRRASVVCLRDVGGGGGGGGSRCCTDSLMSAPREHEYMYNVQCTYTCMHALHVRFDSYTYTYTYMYIISLHTCIDRVGTSTSKYYVLHVGA